MRVTTALTFSEMMRLPAFRGAEEFLLANCYVPDMNLTLTEMEKLQFDWVADSIAAGLNHMIGLYEAGAPIVQDIYSDEEKAKEPDKTGTKLFYMPGKINAPFLIICPGGGYGAVCTLKEGFPVGKRFNELGYHVFVLSYRVRPYDLTTLTSTENVSMEALFPKPIEDLAQTIRIIRERADELGLDSANYALAGFSAGAHLAGIWGTAHLGASRYGLPMPRAIFMGYPGTDPSHIAQIGNREDGRNLMLVNMLGSDYTEEEAERYNVNKWITSDYPAVYLWHCADDPLAFVETSRTMERELVRAGVPHIYREAAKGGHGFGMGEKNPEINGWADEAAKLFAEQIQAPCR